MYKRQEEENECFSLSDLAINGSDLKEFLSGKKIGLALRKCLSMVIDEKLPNEKQALLAFAMKKYGNKE